MTCSPRSSERLITLCSAGEILRAVQPEFQYTQCKLHWSDPDHAGFTRQAEDSFERKEALSIFQKKGWETAQCVRQVADGAVRAKPKLQ